MEFALLGPLQVLGHAGPLSLGGTKQRALLALLLLEANRVVARERLIDGLWGEEPPETAAQTVQVYVSRLRKLLSAGMVVTQSPGYVLEVDPDLVDAHRFARLVGEARSLRPAEAEPLLRQALDLWRGPALAEFADEPTLRAEGARLEEARLAAIELRLQSDLALGRHAVLVGELEALVSQHPHREQFSAQLMLALYRSGRQAEALAAYRRARAALVDELGLEPGQSLQTLEQAILRHDPALDLTAATHSLEATDTASPDAATAVPVAPVRKVVTVVFCDVVVSTTSGEPLDPEALGLVMSRYLEAGRVVLQRHGGLVERQANDAVASVFGVPLLHEDDAIRAVRAAAELRTAIGDLNRVIERDFGSTLDVRIGIDTGEVVTGSDDRPATGEVLSAAARLQQGATPGEILIAADTLAVVRDVVDVDELRPGVYRVTRFEQWPSRGPRNLDAPMIGRADELERLRNAFAYAVEARTCVMCTLLGEAGVGKSRLAREFVISTDEARVLDGRCLPYGEGITYSAVVEVVTQLGGRHGELLAETPAAAATIASMLGESQVSTAPEEIAWSVRKLLEAGAREQPLVVVFDDVQWGEPAFLDLVEHVAYLSTGAPIMLLCLARPELLERRPGWSAAGDNALTILLGPLAADEVGELIDRLLRGEQLEDDLGARIRAAALGNPLFVEEMLALLRETGGGQVVVPPTIKALLAARLDQLEPAERELLACGSIEGELFHRDAVEAIGARHRPVDRDLVALVRKGLLRPDRSPILRDDAYRFHHLLIRDAAYDALPKATRAELHEHFGAWLADHSDQLAERDELLGYHLEQAHRYHAELGNPDARSVGERASGFLNLAGRRATTRGDYHAAVNLLGRALEVGLADPHERVRAQVDLGYSLHGDGKLREAGAVLDQSIGAARELGEHAVAAYALVHRAWGHTGDPDVDFASLQRTAEEARETFAVLGDERGVAVAGRLLALALRMQGRIGASCEELERALVHVDACGDQEQRRRVTTTLCSTLVTSSAPVPESIDRLEELLESAGSDRVLEAVIRRFLSVLFAMAARFEEALELVRASSLVLDELDQLIQWIYRGFAARARELAGDRDGAEQELLAQWSYFRDLRTDAIDSRATGAAYDLARLYCDDRRWDEAAAMISYGQERRDTRPARYLSRLAVEARLAAHRGELSEALELAQRVVAAAEKGDDLDFRAGLWRAVAEVRRAAAQTGDAEDALERALALYEQKGNLAEAARLRAIALDA